MFQGSGQLHIFFNGSLHLHLFPEHVYSAVYSTAKVMGKSAFSAPQSEMSSAVLAVKMQQKISQEMYSIKLFSPVFIGDSEIVLRMIVKNDPAYLPIFYGTRVMGIDALKKSNNWFWCPGPLNPATQAPRELSLQTQTFLTNQEMCFLPVHR